MSFNKRETVFIRDFADIKIRQRIDMLAPPQPNPRLQKLRKRQRERAQEDAAIDDILNLVGKKCRSSH